MTIHKSPQTLLLSLNFDCKKYWFIFIAFKKYVAIHWGPMIKTKPNYKYMVFD